MTSTTPSKDTPKRRRGTCLRLLVQMSLSVTLLGFLFWKIDLTPPLDAIRSIHLDLFLAAMFLYNGGMILSAYRWQLLLAAKAIHVPLFRLILFYFQGMFCNLFLPTSVGGDVLRGYAIYRASQRQEAAVVSVLVDRLLGVVALMGLALIGLCMGVGLWVGLLVPVLIIGLIVALIAGINLFRRPELPRLRQGRWWYRPLMRVLIKLRSFATHYVILPWTLIEGLGLSGLIQIRVICVYVLLALGLELHVPLSAFLFFVPIITLLSMLPISLGGLGVREGLTVLLFANVGVTAVSATSLSLAFFGVTLLSSFLGVFAFVLDRYCYN